MVPSPWQGFPASRCVANASEPHQSGSTVTSRQRDFWSSDHFSAACRLGLNRELFNDKALCRYSKQQNRHLLSLHFFGFLSGPRCVTSRRLVPTRIWSITRRTCRRVRAHGGACVGLPLVRSNHRPICLAPHQTEPRTDLARLVHFTLLQLKKLYLPASSVMLLRGATPRHQQELSDSLNHREGGGNSATATGER